MARSVAIKIAIDGKSTVDRQFEEIATGGGVQAERMRAKWDREVQGIEAAVARANRTAQRLQGISQTPIQSQIGAATGAGSSGNAAAAASARALSQELNRAEAEARQLIAAIDPLFAAQQRYGTNVARINELKSVGALSGARYQQLLAAEDSALRRATTAQQQHAQMSALSRAGYQQLSFQIGDVVQQLALGINPAIVFAQQVGQVVQAMTLIREGRGNANDNQGGFLAGAPAALEQMSGASEKAKASTEALVTALGVQSAAAEGNSAATAANAGAKTTQTAVTGSATSTTNNNTVATGVNTTSTEANAVATNSATAAKARFAAFMAGPWGAALLGGITVLALLGAKLFDTRSELEKASDELLENARKAEINRQAQEAYGRTLPGVTERIREQTAALQAQNRTLAENQQLLFDQRRNDATTQAGNRDAITQQLAAARQRLAETQATFRSTRANPAFAGDDLSGFTDRIARQTATVRDLEQQLSRVSGSVAEAQRGVGEAYIPIARRLADELRNEEGRIRAQYERQEREAELAAGRDPRLMGSLAETIGRIRNQRDARLDALRPNRSAAQQGRNAEALEADAQGARDVAEAYLESAAAGLRMEAVRRAITDATRRGIDVESRVRRQLDLQASETAARGAEQVRQMLDETEARRGINEQVLAGTIAVDDMNLYLQEEAQLRPYLQQQAVAQGAAYEKLTRIINEMRRAMRAAHQEAVRSDTLQAIGRMQRDEQDLVRQAALIGAQPRARAVGEARIRATREADERDMRGPERDGFIRWREQTAGNDWDFRAKDSMAQQNEQLDQRLALLRFELSLGGMGEEQRRRLLTIEEARLGLIRDYGELDAAAIEQMLAKIRAAEALTAELRQQQEAQRELQQIGGQVIDDVFNIRNWDDWGAAGKRVIQMLLQELVILAAVNPLKNMLFGQNNPTIGSVLGTLFSAGGAALGAPIGGKAVGTANFTGGMTWIAENGPELVSLPRGSKITPAAETRRLLAANDGGREGLTVNIDATGADAAGLQRVEMAIQRLDQSLERRAVSATLQANENHHGRLYGGRR